MSKDIFDFVAYMHRDACYSDIPGYITTEEAAYDLHEHAAQGLSLPEGITPEIYASLWNHFSDEHENGPAYAEKAKQMENMLRNVRSMLKIARPDLDLDVVYARETAYTIDSFTEFQRSYYGIRPNEEYITVWCDDALLYVVNVTADSVLTAIAELMDLLSRKF